ncbi:unnamed protein product, partial [Symbiodinium pilosum]
AAKSPEASTGTPGSVIPGQMQSFRICVPQPYPGVQIRKSPNLDDKHNRFLQDGKFVTGTVDKDGQWVRLSGKHFLPVKVGGIQVLHPVEPQDIPPRASHSPKPVSEEETPVRPQPAPPAPLPPAPETTGYWPWTCCTGPAVSLAVSESNDLHVHPPESATAGGESGSNLLTPVVVSTGAGQQAGYDRVPERP